MPQYHIYILADHRYGTIYIGVTNDLIRRMFEHKNDLVEGFTKKYKTHTLVYFEQANEVRTAIEREKQLKSWNRKKKIALIESQNPAWLDLYEGLL